MLKNLRVPQLITASYLTFAASLTLFSCGKTHSNEQSSLDDLVFDRSANNVALIFGAPQQGKSDFLAGVKTDLVKLREMFEDQKANLGFKVVVIEKTTFANMKEAIRTHAAEVGERGTLLFYYSGHGAQSGCMYLEDGSCKTFEPVAKEIQAARSTPIKRFFAFFDSCFSGQLVNGDNAIISGTTYESAVADNVQASINGLNTYTNDKLFEQALVMSAARASETSQDLGASMGGAFTYSFRTALNKLVGNKSATIKDLVTTAISTTKKTSGNSHTPVFRTLPSDVILADKLFGEASDTNTTNPVIAPITSSSDLYAALDSQATGDTANIFVSAGLEIARIAICMGDMKTCLSAPKEDLGFKTLPTNSISGRNMFVSNGLLNLASGQPVMLLGINVKNELVKSQQIKFQKK